MTEEEYRRLCAACDTVLRGPGMSMERLAIGWLHVLNEHPTVLQRYEHLFSGSPGRTPRPVRSLLYQLKNLVVRERKQPEPAGDERIDVMFVSHLLNASQASAAEDFYFGRLPEMTAAEGISTRLVLMNHTGVSPGRLASQPTPKGRVPRTILPNVSDARGELRLRARMRNAARSLRAEARGCEDDLLCRVYDEAARRALTVASLEGLRTYEQIRAYARRWRPKAIVLTYEGHAWERLAFAAVRSVVPDAKCVGYHHTILFRRQHAALQLLGPPFDPDVILTAGEVSRERFRAAVAPAGVLVETLGIHRRQAVSEAGPAETGSKPLCCLVVPDGIVSEVERLFDFAVAAARLSDVRFLLRLHPVLQFHNVLKEAPRFGSLPPNVELSTATFTDDLARARWVLYRASNAAVYAVIAGLRPLCAQDHSEMSVDSLHHVEGWKRVVASPAELVEQIESDVAKGWPALAPEAEAAAAHCRKYFMPTDHRVLLAAVRS